MIGLGGIGQLGGLYNLEGVNGLVGIGALREEVDYGDYNRGSRWPFKRPLEGLLWPQPFPGLSPVVIFSTLLRSRHIC